MSNTIDRFAADAKQRLRDDEREWYIEDRDTEGTYRWIDWAALNKAIDDLCAEFKKRNQ